MMKLSTMQAVVATLNEQWESPLAEELLARWEHDEECAKYWRSSANFVFFFKASGRDRVLRFNHASERTASEIQAELAYINALAKSGVRVAQPVCSITGKDVESVDTGQGRFHAVVFEALPGKQLDLEELTADQLVRWGRALAELHQAAPHYTQPGRPSWQDQLNTVPKILPTEERGALEELARLRRELNQLAITEQNFGLIHYDFEPDNLLWDGDQPGIIDFDDCAWYWFVADIALAVSDLFDDSARAVDLQNEAFQHFITGYRSVRPLAPTELALIPLFIRVQNLVAFTRLYCALTPVNPAGEPEWMVALRTKLAAKMQFYRHEFGGNH
jgi:Ser/Thr protein kinase RdoA (MazF antagonist)